jgi:replicative DNA helicase
MKQKTLPTRVPPHNIEAEQAILGAMFVNARVKPKAKNSLNSEDFYKEAHSHIFRVLLENKSDVIVVCQALSEQNLLERVGGQEYVGSLSECCSTSAHIEHYIHIVKELSERRQIISLCQNSLEEAHREFVKPDEILSQMKSGIRNIQSEKRAGYRENVELVKAVFKDIERRKGEDNKALGPLSGFRDLDQLIGGFEPKSLTYIIGRPSMGKTSFGLNIADFMAENYSGKVPFFSLEMGDEALTRRRLSACSGIYLRRIRRGDFEDSQWPDLIKAADKLSLSNLIIIDSPKFKLIERLVSTAETLAMEFPLTALFIDHIQLMRCEKRPPSRHLEISHISNELKGLSKELNIPVIALCQLKRDIESRKDKRPQLYDMKESGDLEQDADIVIGVYRSDLKEPATEMGILKGRDLGTGKINLYFDRHIQKFSDRSTNGQ